ncbi:subtilisin family serine protease [Actinomyces oris]|uniref:Subtilisin family serine protease n=1 Tax=Actinomyces oris TaxID=544580 RepID=A0A1Q8V6E8_9ACTO|nr:S8 family peptidase [Actinomyces oris]OLO43654.1 subtilisin family serine protease [Actinomyces oris]
MPESPRLDHLYVNGYVESKPRTARGMGNTTIRPVDRQTHGKRLIEEIETAFAGAQKTQDSQSLAPELKANGTYLTLEGAEVEFGLKLDSLTRTARSRTKSRKTQWILLSAHPATENSPERATVWVADEFKKRFLKLFEDYLTKNTDKGNPENNALVSNISRIRSTFLDDLWTSKYAPTHRELTWWELWLDRHRERPGIFERITRELGIEASNQRIVIDNSVVVRVRAIWKDLLPLIETDLPLTEIRCPSFIDTIEDLADCEQMEYASDLVTRIFPAPLEAPAVCHLDSGVFRTHILLESSLESGDQHSIFPESSGHDPHGHGTSMAGIALYGQHLDRLLEGTQVVHLQHRLESVRIIPQKGEKTKKDYASATIDAISCSETNEDRQRAFCMPVSTKSDTDPGQPTLWSTSIDALAAGSDIYILNNEFSLVARPNHNAKRLIVVSAANVDSYDVDHLANSDVSPIEDPGQSWNALTVGAFTQLDQEPHHPRYTNYTPLAPAGELSPHSRTSLLFGDHLWPIKPEICLEGGNVLTDGQGFFETRPPVLSLRSTGIKNDVDLTSANATSAATAQAARLAALTMSRYPSYWPETVRALLVHEARWTERMRTHLDACETKSGRARLLRRYGWGVPTEEAVLTSSRRAVTMVVQDEFCPFDETYAMRELRLHSLPWPRDVLQSLGEADVHLRITLSYFIEPSATRRGWKGKYTYASYGLRFDLKAPTDINVEGFLARVNRQAREEEDEDYSSTDSHSNHWLLGTRARHYGSLHQDEWQGTGAELAACDHIAVYPVGGWWKNNNRRDRRDLPVRYALLVSLNTSTQGADLYTPIATQLSVPITAVPIEV